MITVYICQRYVSTMARGTYNYSYNTLTYSSRYDLKKKQMLGWFIFSALLSSYNKVRHLDEWMQYTLVTLCFGNCYFLWEEQKCIVILTFYCFIPSILSYLFDCFVNSMSSAIHIITSRVPYWWPRCISYANGYLPVSLVRSHRITSVRLGFNKCRGPNICPFRCRAVLWPVAMWVCPIYPWCGLPLHFIPWSKPRHRFLYLYGRTCLALNASHHNC